MNDDDEALARRRKLEQLEVNYDHQRHQLARQQETLHQARLTLRRKSDEALGWANHGMTGQHANHFLQASLDTQQEFQRHMQATLNDLDLQAQQLKHDFNRDYDEASRRKQD